MMVTLQDRIIDAETFSVRVRPRGQVTIPQTMRHNLALNIGDTVVLWQLGEVILLSPKPLRVPQLVDQFSELMEMESISLADLLQGLEDERAILWRERQASYQL